METLLGLIGVAVFVAGMLVLSAAVTFAVVKLTSRRKDDATPAEPAS
jgi:hypothetical protein